MIRIVTDSTVQLPPSAVDRYNIVIVPTTVIIDGVSYRDGIDLSTSEFYRLLREAEVIPTTTQPSPGDFQQVYEKLTAEGAEIISIHLPSTLSGTVNSARQAAELVEEGKITVVETPWVAAAQGFIILEAVRAIEAGASVEEVIEKINQLIPRLNLIFALDTLEYIHRGGRIGGAQAWLGTLLKIKPILYLKDGKVEPLDRVRTWRRVPARLLKLMEELMGAEEGPIHVGVLHSQNEEDAAKLEAQIRERFDVAELFISEIGPVVGAHTGPGALGVAFYR